MRNMSGKARNVLTGVMQKDVNGVDETDEVVDMY